MQQLLPPFSSVQACITQGILQRCSLHCYRILRSFSSLLVFITSFSTPFFLIFLHLYSQCIENTLNAITPTVEGFCAVFQYFSLYLAESECWYSNYSHNQGILPYSSK